LSRKARGFGQEGEKPRPLSLLKGGTGHEKVWWFGEGDGESECKRTRRGQGDPPTVFYVGDDTRSLRERRAREDASRKRLKRSGEKRHNTHSWRVFSAKPTRVCWVKNYGGGGSLQPDVRKLLCLLITSGKSSVPDRARRKGITFREGSWGHDVLKKTCASGSHSSLGGKVIHNPGRRNWTARRSCHSRIGKTIHQGERQTASKIIKPNSLRQEPTATKETRSQKKGLSVFFKATWSKCLQEEKS